MDRASLERAYRATTYRAGGLALRVDDPHPALDRLLSEKGLDGWAYLTAYNPRSTPLPRGENEARQARLLSRLSRHLVLLGEASPDAGGWEPEPSVLALGIARDDAQALGREFEQNAILCGERGGRARLLWLRAP